MANGSKKGWRAIFPDLQPTATCRLPDYADSNPLGLLFRRFGAGFQMSRSCTENFETVKFMPEIISKSPAMRQESVNTTQTFRRALFRDDFPDNQPSMSNPL